MKRTRIIIVRHGESLSNINRETTGWLPSELSEKGLTQVKHLGHALKNEEIDIIISSDLRRAKQTTDAIAEFHSVDTRFVEALRERCYGEFDGRHAQEFIDARDSSGLPFNTFRPKDGESLESLLIRASNFWRFWAPQAKGRTILISGHGTFNKILLMFLLGKTFEDWADLHQDNACINIIVENEKGIFETEKINSTEHLSERID